MRTGSHGRAKTSASPPVSMSLRTCGLALEHFAPMQRRLTRQLFSGLGSTDDELATVYPSEDWILAQNRCGPISHQETSLFDGLAQVVSET